MKFKYIVITLTVMCVLNAGNLFAASSGSPESVTLEQLAEKLENQYTISYPSLTRSLPMFYMEAKSRLEEAHLIIKNRELKKSWPLIMESCSLLVEAAVLDLQSELNFYTADSLQKQRDSILLEINKTYRQINQIERTYSSDLKKNLEEERRNALERLEKARQRFNLLQSDLINVRNDARGIILSMSDILFDVDKASLTPVLKTNLAKIAGILFVYRESEIIVEGHTDNVGTPEYNQKLSEKRAENVANFLAEQGIPIERLSAVGFGLTKPVADNATKEGRQKNRRVDLVITEPKQN